MTKRREYKVGRGKPPKKNQFKPGQSGNPRGRPPKPVRRYSTDQVHEDLLASLEQEVTVNRDGKPTKLPIIQAIYDQLAVNAARGDFRSIKLITDLLGATMEKKEESTISLVATIIEMDKEFGDDAIAYPHLVEEISKQRAAFRESAEVLEAFRRIDRPMPKRGNLTPAESLLDRTVEIPWDKDE